jgi:hypothetical protein
MEKRIGKPPSIMITSCLGSPLMMGLPGVGTFSFKINEF